MKKKFKIKGLRLNIRKAPKIEVPKTVYSHKLKRQLPHPKGRGL
jgi:hypothetical protein